MILGFTLACQSPVEPTGYPVARSATIDSAYQVAVECGTRHGLTIKRPYASLVLYLSPNLGSTPAGTRADYGYRNRIWVDERVAGEMRVWAHALLHGLYNLPGGISSPHPPIFHACNLWPL